MGSTESSASKLALTTTGITADMTLTDRIPRSFTLRTRIACWLIGLAGRVIDVPCEVEMVRDADAPVPR